MPKIKLQKLTKWLLAIVFVAVLAANLFGVVQKATAASSPTISDAGSDLTKMSLSYSLISHPADADKGPYEVAVLTGWRICLGLANIFVILILVFLAVVNIAHIQYDTYNLRKTLPWLIIGIILANFSLVICRMLLDAANILTQTFTQGDIAHNLIAKIIVNLGLAKTASATGGAAGASLLLLFLGSGALSIALGLVLLFLVLLPVLAVVVILFLLYIRIAVLLFLAMIAPLAFVMLAFPATQKFFKEWWSWFLKWTFMKPIMFFLLWAASILGATSNFSLVSYAITLALTYLSFTVPFKLGGAVMAGWSKAGQWATGTGKGGYLRKPLDTFAQNTKDEWKGRANRWAEKNTAIGRWRNNQQKLLEGIKEDREANMAKLENERRERKAELARRHPGNPRYQSVEEGEIENRKMIARLEQGKQDREFEIYTGVKGRELAEFEGEIANSALRLEKIKDDHRFNTAGERLRADAELDEDPGLKDAHKKVDSAATKLTMARNDDERRAAQAELTAAQRDLTTEQARVATGLVGRANPLTGAIFANQAEALKYVKSAHLQKYQRTRFYKIYNTRVAEDAQTDALSYVPSDVSGDLVGKIETYRTTHTTLSAQLAAGAITRDQFDERLAAVNEEITYGPNAAKISDFVAYLQHDGVNKVSSAGAASVVTAKLQQLRLQMKDPRLMGDSIQAEISILDAANPGFSDKALQEAIGRLSGEALRELETDLSLTIDPATGRPTVASLKDAIKRQGINTSNRYQRELGSAIASQLEKGDLKGFTDPTTGAVTNGASGLGTSAFGYVQKT